MSCFDWIGIVTVVVTITIAIATTITTTIITVVRSRSIVSRSNISGVQHCAALLSESSWLTAIARELERRGSGRDPIA